MYLKGPVKAFVANLGLEIRSAMAASPHLSSAGSSGYPVPKKYVRTDLQWQQVAMEISDERSKKDLLAEQYMSAPTDKKA